MNTIIHPVRRIREDIQAFLAKDPAAGSALEVALCYPGLHALWAHRVSHRLWNNGYRLQARLHSNLARMLTGVEIHPAAVIGRRVVIDHGSGVVIGQTAVVGDDCLFYHGATLGGHSLSGGKRHPTLGNNVMVGTGAKILGDITIGDNTKIGANAVVTKSLPADVAAGGIPARILEKAKI